MTATGPYSLPTPVLQETLRCLTAFTITNVVDEGNAEGYHDDELRIINRILTFANAWEGQHRLGSPPSTYKQSSSPGSHITLQTARELKVADLLNTGRQPSTKVARWPWLVA